MALFITFEGGEGSSKSTQARMLCRRLLKSDVPAILVHEPGVTSLGRRAARLLKWARDIDISPVAELMLFNSARAQLVDEIIRPALDNGKTVICDRFADSSTAYQGYGRGLDLIAVKNINRSARRELTPDLTILLDIPVEDGLARKNGKKDRFEAESVAFHRRVREGYLKMAADEPKRWLVVDAAKSRNEIAEVIWQRVSKLLSGKG